MSRSTMAVSLCLLLALGAIGCSDDKTPAVFTGTLNASAAVPPNPSPATGAATLDFDGDSAVQFRVDVHSMTGIMSAHVHSGAEGATGPIRVSLFTGPTTGPTDGQLAQGSFGGSDVQGISFDALLEEMRNGTAYVDVHTTARPDGEIRGQIRQQ